LQFGLLLAVGGSSVDTVVWVVGQVEPDVSDYLMSMSVSRIHNALAAALSTFSIDPSFPMLSPPDSRSIPPRHVLPGLRTSGKRAKSHTHQGIVEKLTAANVEFLAATPCMYGVNSLSP